MANECLNCCEEIVEGKEVYDEEGNLFCSEDHKNRWHEAESEEKAKKETLFFAEVKMFSGKYHIFKTGQESCLCGRYRLPFDLKEDDKVYVKGNENFKKSQDCKVCFKKANLKIPEEPKKTEDAEENGI